MLNRYRVENQAQGGKLVLLALAVRLADLAPAPVADRLRRHVDHRVADPALPTVRQPAGRLALEVSRSVIALVSYRDVRTGELLLDRYWSSGP